MKKAVIFGVNGQDGHYVRLLCRQRGIDPIGVSRSCAGVIGDVARYYEVEEIITAPGILRVKAVEK